MPESLIQKLSALSGDLTIDQVLLHIHDPIPTWVQGDYVTQELIDKFGETPIVICHRDYNRELSCFVEMEHKLSTHDFAFPHWNLDHYQHRILRRGGLYWFRSLKSFEANPTEGFDPNIHNYRPFGMR